MKKKWWLVLSIMVLTISLILPLTSCKKKQQNQQEPEDQIAYEFVEGSTIYIKMGTYPQTIAKDVTVSEIKENGTYSEKTGYYTYNGNEYKIIKANPCTQDMTPTFSNGEVAVKDKEYAFLVEPIIWKIINKALKEEYYFAYSNCILDTSIYQKQENIGSNTSGVINYYLYDENHKLLEEEEIYANNWINSVLRQNLIKFYDVAFTDANKSAIKVAKISNSSPNSGKNYFPSHQQDSDEFCFVLSSSEAQKSKYGYTTEDKTNRLRKVTDYAVANGVFCLKLKDDNYYGWAWTRTAGTSSNNVYIIDTQGNLDTTLIADDSNLKVGYAPAMYLTII